MTDSDALDCPHGTRCGGCAFIGVPYPEQLERKRAGVALSLARYPEHSRLRVANVAGAAPTVAYRTRAKLVLGEDGALGLFERDSHRVVDIPECRVLAPALSRVAAAARRVLGTESGLDGLDLRLVDDGVQATLIARRDAPLGTLRALARALSEAAPELRSVAASFRDAHAATVLGTGHVLLSGAEVERHHLHAEGPYHLAAHGAFIQAHLGQANRAHEAIERALRARGARRVLEVYAGSAALSLRLSAAGFAMTAVEAFAPALAHAERAAREQHLQLSPLTGQAERVLRELARQGERFGALIVNPPRRGLSREVRSSAAALGPEQILYMSCDPATLARDLGHLALLGYEAQELWPFDMIPHSAAVECLVDLRRAEPPLPRVLRETEQLVAVFKPGYLALAGKVADLDWLTQVRRLAGASDAVPLPSQALDDDSSGVCLFARHRAALPDLEAAFRAGSQSFVGLARGITHKRGRIRRPVREARRVVSAGTRYVREGVLSGHSLLTIWPEGTNSLHVRQLLAGVGHPILGDARFGDAPSNGFFEHRHGLDRSFLHCSAVTLALASGPLTIEAPLPGELAAVLASLAEPAATPG